ncbi:hypothetical protein GGI21_001803, partial [Coemansia aciculifera]
MWESLRSHYPPKCSELEPLVSATTNGDDYSIALIQAATMTSHAIELLQDAAASQDVKERCVQQTNDLLTTLCDALIETRDEHRYRRARASEQASERSSNAQHKDGTKHQSIGRVESSGSGQTKRWHPYLRDRSLLAPSRENNSKATTPAARKRPGAVEAISTERADDNNDGNSEASTLATTSNQVLTQPPEEQSRRQVVRAAFLRQGLTESDIAVYFNG